MRFAPLIGLILITLSALLHQSAAAQVAPPAGACFARAVPPSADDAFPLNPELMGLVIRDPWYEFNTHPSYPDQPNYVFQERMAQAMQDLGVRWVRFEFRIEGSDPLTQIARYDYFINELAPRYNLKILGLLGFGLLADRSPWELQDGKLDSDPLYGGGVNEYMRIWLDRARLIAERYQGKIAAYEILNEQNRLPADRAGNHTGDGISADVAARLHTKFYRFFRVVDRANAGQEWRDGVAIILGGLHPRGTTRPDGITLTDREYLVGRFAEDGSVLDRGYYNSDGFVSYRETYGCFPLDGLGYHPYPEEIKASTQASVDLIALRLSELRNALFAVGDGQIPFWITEIGYNSAYWRQTEAGQTEFLRAVYAHFGARGDVANIFWFKYEDFPPADGPNAQRWGLVHIPFVEANIPGGAIYAADGEPTVWRPAALSYRLIAGAPVQRTFLPLITQ